MEKKQRSIDQHRRFFGMIAAVFNQWPEAHKFQPESAEHLRAWLLIKAGHSIIKTFILSDDASEVARLVPVITASMLGKHSWAHGDGNELKVWAPASISFDSVSHQDFQKINDDVEAVIRAETGLDPERVLRGEMEAA